MSVYVSAALRQQVIDRAQSYCEYCLLPEAFSIYHHEVDHLIALKHGGQTASDNLVLACLPCNRHKGSDLTSIDPVSGKVTLLFNPRIQLWSEHFQLQEGYILGLSATGRTTVFLLRFNDSTRIQVRQNLIAYGLYPNSSDASLI
ncbi:HNH endonuclease [Altericista sp. CCNU0014]|uniref:HNH endonuclease n=1 Tax=Altericista sp. CCNU0014 TaxID=3082949 RepID=UPI00384FFAE0